MLDGDVSLGPLLGTAVGHGAVQGSETTHHEPGLVNPAVVHKRCMSNRPYLVQDASVLAFCLKCNVGM